MNALSSHCLAQHRQRCARVFAAILVVATAGVASTACADINKSGAYLTMLGGTNALGDQRVEATIGGTTGNGLTSYSASYIAGFSVGYRFDNNWSIEEEFTFRRVNLNSASLGALGSFNEGDIENTQLTARALYHVPLSANANFEVYVGAGVAWLAELDFDVEGPEGEQPFEQDRFGVEFHSGLRYHGWRHAFVGAGLRYLSVRDTTLPSPSNPDDTVRLSYDPFSAIVEFGWRF